MTVAEVEIHRSIEAVEDEWDRLADLGPSTPFHRPGWIAAWWRAFGGGQLEIWTVRRGDRLAAVLPLVRSGRELRSPTNPHTPRFGPLGAPEACRALGDAVFRDRPDHVALGFLDPDDPRDAALVAAAGGAGYRIVARPLLRSPYLDLGGKREAFFGALDPAFRRELRRRRRRLEELGPVSFEVVGGEEDDWPRRLEAGLEVEASGWKSRSGTAVRSSPRTTALYTEVAEWAAKRGWLRLADLRLGGRVVAFDLCLETGDAHYLVKTGFADELRRLAPGVQLRARMIERAFDLGLRTYEFLGTDDPWKLVWTGTTRLRERVQAFTRTPRGSARWLWAARLRPALGRARRVLRR